MSALFMKDCLILYFAGIQVACNMKNPSKNCSKITICFSLYEDASCHKFIFRKDFMISYFFGEFINKPTLWVDLDVGYNKINGKHSKLSYMHPYSSLWHVL